MTVANRLYFGPHHSFLAIAALLCFLFGANEIVLRLLIEAEGIVVSSETSSGNRPATTYLLLRSDGTQQEYVSGPTDHSLPRRLPVGTHISKQRYSLAWKQNGQVVNDFPVYFYVGACVLGAMLGYWAFFQWRINRPDNAAHVGSDV